MPARRSGRTARPSGVAAVSFFAPRKRTGWCETIRFARSRGYTRKYLNRSRPSKGVFFDWKRGQPSLRQSQCSGFVAKTHTDQREISH